MRADDPNDDAPDPSGPASPRPSPFDRPWIHPSELSPYVAAPAAFTSQSTRREWTIGTVSAVVGIVVTVLTLVAFGALGGRNPTTVSGSAITTPSGIVDYQLAYRLTTRLEDSIVTVRVGPPDGAGISGVVVSGERVITVAHALQGAATATVLTSDGRTLTATVVGTDPDTDVALLRVDGANLAPVRMGSSDGLVLGQVVVALAVRGREVRPLAGILSSRNFVVKGANGDLSLVGLLESDMRTAPEDTGGALLDYSGALVGMLVTAPGDTRTGLAIPAAVLEDVTDQLATTGNALHGWLGVSVADALPVAGAAVTMVATGSPAAKVNIAPGDVIRQVDGRTVNGAGDLLAYVRLRKPGDSMDLTVTSGTERSRRVTVKLGATGANGGGPRLYG